MRFFSAGGPVTAWQKPTKPLRSVRETALARFGAKSVKPIYSADEEGVVYLALGDCRPQNEKPEFGPAARVGDSLMQIDRILPGVKHNENERVSSKTSAAERSAYPQ